MDCLEPDPTAEDAAPAEAATATAPEPGFAPAPKSHRERDDGYEGVVLQLDDRWRVIRCKDDHQWIVQHLDARVPHRGFWRGVKYWRTRKALIGTCVGILGPNAGWAVDILITLPENYQPQAFASLHGERSRTGTSGLGKGPRPERVLS